MYAYKSTHRTAASSNNKTNKKVAFTFCSKFVSKRNSQQISKQ